MNESANPFRCYLNEHYFTNVRKKWYVIQLAEVLALVQLLKLPVCLESRRSRVCPSLWYSNFKETKKIPHSLTIQSRREPP